MDIPLDEVIYVEAISSSSTGAAADADSTPTFAVYEEATDTDIGVGGNMTKRTSLTGDYRASFTASAANGFEVGKWYAVIGSATIGGIATKGVLARFRITLAETVVGEPKVDVGAWLGTAVSTPTVAGVPNVNAKTINDVATTSITTINANLGETQPVNFTGTGASALVKTDMVDIAGAAVSTSTAQIGVNLVNIAGSPVSTSTAQLGVNVVNWKGTAAATVDTAGYPVVTVKDGTGAGEINTNAGAIALVDLVTATSSVTGAVGSVTGNVGGNVVGSVASVTGNVGGNVVGTVASVVGAVGSVTGNVGGNVTGSVGSVATGGIVAASFGAGAITATVIATGAIDADALAADVVNDIWMGTALTETYAADGATATPAQLMYMIWSYLVERSISSTTQTCKKLDGSTTSMTFTLDSATAPTSVTRAS